MLGTELGDLDHPITGSHHVLGDTFDLVTEHNGVGLARFWLEIMEHLGPFGLFDGQDLYPIGLQGVHQRQGVFTILPCYAFGRPLGSFANVFMGWCSGDAAEVDFLNQKGIGGTKDGTDVVQTPNIVQNNDQGGFVGFFEFFRIQSIQLAIGQLPHNLSTFGPEI